MFSNLHESLFTHKFVQQILINKHVPGIALGPGGLKDGKTPAQLLRGLQCNTRDGHAKHFLQYSKLPPRRYLQETVRTWAMEGAPVWRNQGNPVEEAATELTLTPDKEITMPRHADRQARGTTGAQTPRPRGTSEEQVMWLFLKRKVAGRDYRL